MPTRLRIAHPLSFAAGAEEELLDVDVYAPVLVEHGIEASLHPDCTAGPGGPATIRRIPPMAREPGRRQPRRASSVPAAATEGEVAVELAAHAFQHCVGRIASHGRLVGSTLDQGAEDVADCDEANEIGDLHAAKLVPVSRTVRQFVVQAHHGKEYAAGYLGGPACRRRNLPSGRTSRSRPSSGWRTRDPTSGRGPT